MVDTCSKRVLSVQSHVVHGYNGNNAATFPLQVSWTACMVTERVQSSACWNKKYSMQLLEGTTATNNYKPTTQQQPI